MTIAGLSAAGLAAADVAETGSAGVGSAEARSDESPTLTSAAFIADGAAALGGTSMVLSNVVPATGALAVAPGALPDAEGNPPAATEPSFVTEPVFDSRPANVPATGGEAGASCAVAAPEVEALPGAGADSGSGYDGVWSAVVRGGASACRRKMPPNPSDTGGAGAFDRPRLAFSAGPTVTMIRFPSAFIV